MVWAALPTTAAPLPPESTGYTPPSSAIRADGLGWLNRPAKPAIGLPKSAPRPQETARRPTPLRPLPYAPTGAHPQQSARKPDPETLRPAGLGRNCREATVIAPHASLSSSSAAAPGKPGLDPSQTLPACPVPACPRGVLLLEETRQIANPFRPVGGPLPSPWTASPAPGPRPRWPAHRRTPHAQRTIARTIQAIIHHCPERTDRTYASTCAGPVPLRSPAASNHAHPHALDRSL